ncbi:hypothetical protein M0802_016550 [Mischocyttarus mexicanus]|nr:hypothetical protein M0802_016550 [Mischocyttarus mexicanus]
MTHGNGQVKEKKHREREGMTNQKRALKVVDALGCTAVVARKDSLGTVRASNEQRTTTTMTTTTTTTTTRVKTLRVRVRVRVRPVSRNGWCLQKGRKPFRSSAEFYPRKYINLIRQHTA